jgi:hypothetical protein
MYKKLVGFLVITLLIAISIPAVSSTNYALTTFKRNEQQKNDIFFDTTSVPLPGGEGWVKTFGGLGNDWGRSIQHTSDGGYIITGWTSSFGAGSTDVWLIKTNSNGDEEWTRTFGGINYDEGWSVQQTSDSGYIITGETKLLGGKTDVLLIKTDSNGNEIWNKTFGGEDWNSGRSVKQISDGGYIITGSTGPEYPTKLDVLLIKTDSNGNVKWSRTFGGSSPDRGYSVLQTSDGGFIITGTGEFWLIKTDSDGNKEWSRPSGGYLTKGGCSIQQTNDGGYIVAGGSEARYCWLIKTDSNGNEKWSRTFGGTNIYGGSSVQQTSDGGYIITGSTRSGPHHTPHDIYILKTDANGNKVWDKLYGRKNMDDRGASVQQTTDGGYIITGCTESFGAREYDVLLMKTDSFGRSKDRSIDNPILRLLEDHPLLFKMFHIFFK